MPTAYDDIDRLSTLLKSTREPEARARLTAELKSAAERLSTSTTRKAPFIEDDVAERRSLELRVRDICSRVSRTDEQRDAAKFNDEVVILSACLHNRDPRSTRFWHEGLQERPWLQKALDTSTGADWIPTEVSADLAAQVRLETRVAALLNHVNMPTPVYKLPVGGNPPRAHLIPENSGADDYLDSTKLIPASEPVIGAKAILTARKVGVRCVPSVELVEDSIIPALPFIQEEIVRSMAEAREDAIINGKKASGLDGDSGGATDVRRWIDGFRTVASSASFGNGVAVAQTSTAGRIELQDIRKLRQKMGKYALNPADCFWLTNSAGYNQLLGLTDSLGNSLVVTREKFGPDATLVTGSLSALDGIGIILSQFVREDLNRSGVHDGVTTDSSLVLLVNRKQWVWGDYRTPTLKSREVIETDEMVLVSTMRASAVAYRPTEPVCAYMYDVRIPA